MARTGKVLLARDIKIDKGYKNVLDYSESQIVTLLNNNLVASFTNCSFLRTENAIDVELSYGTALQANYIGFQNPDYSNKWFFGFITDVEYKSDKTQRIHFEIDEFTTWYSYWDPKTCFVVREHTNDDTVGANTLPENVDLGEFIFNGNAYDFAPVGPANHYICMGVSELIAPFNQNNPLTNWLTVYGGLYSGLQYMFFDSWVSLQRTIDWYAHEGKSGQIATLFVVPAYFINYSDPKTHTYWVQSESNTITVTWLEPTDVPLTVQFGMVKPTSLAGFVPKNNKLYTFPFNFFTISNNAGTEVEYRYEDFATIPQFEVSATLCPSMSIKCTPYNYKNGALGNSWGEGIVGGKTPQCSWITDYYTNWLTQNAVNEGLTAIKAFNPFDSSVNILSGLESVVQSRTKASFVPDTVNGNVNAGDINFTKTKGGFTYLPKCIKPEYARIIDDYFTLKGYQVNRLKVPNQTGRTYWNYVKIADGEEIAMSNKPISVPAKSIDVINNIYRTGVTIWHDHAHMGDFSLNNTILP